MGSRLQRIPIRTQIFLLVLAIVVPVAAMLVWILGAEVRHAREAALDKVRILAAGSATDVVRHLRQSEATLARLAARPKVKALDARQCDPVIDEFVRLNPELLTLSLRDREANLVCSFLSRAPGADRVAKLPWFIDGLRSEKFSVSGAIKSGDAFLGRASGRWIAVLTYPVRDDAGRVTGLLALTVDLLKLSGELFEAGPQNTIVAVLDKSNTIVLRSVDAGAMIGRPVEKAEPGVREGSFVNVAADGVKRMFGFVTIPGVEWRVVAGLPEAEVFAEYRATLWRSLAVGAGVLLLALLLAWRIGAAILTPVTELAVTVAAVAAGDTAARAREGGPAEIEAVARQFNRLLDARDQGERFLRGFVDRLPAMTGYWDRDLICRFANRAYIDWFGQTPEQLTGRHLREVLGDAGFTATEAFARAALQGMEQRFERSLRMASGREGHLLIHYVPDRVDGEVKGFFASAIDITEGKRAAAATREAAQRLEIALEGSRISVWEADMRTDEVRLDAAWSIFLGGPAVPTHTTVTQLLQGVHADDRGSVLAAAVRTLRGEVSRYSLDHRVQAADGEWRWIQSSGRVIERGPDGRALRMSGTNTDITERRQAEAALQESEARYRTLIEWLPEAIHVHRDGRLLYVNPAAIKLYGAQCAADLVGTPSIDLVHPDYREVAQERTRSMIEQGVSAPMIEVKFIRLDGGVIDVESRGTPIIYDGKPAIYVSVRDITERKRAEATLAAKTELLRDTFDNMTEGISVVGPAPELRLEAWNRRFAELLGLPDSLFNENTTFVDIIRYNAQRGEYGPGDIEEQVRGRVELATHVKPHRIERTRPDGSVLVIQGVPLPRGGFVTTYRDITDRKKSELALRIAATAFESQEGIVITDAANVILRVNQAFSEITGYSAEEVVGRNPRLLASGRHDLVFFASMMENLHGEGRWKGEIWNRRKSGEVYPEMLTITAVKDDAGVVTHYVGTFTDISAHKTAEDQIKHLAFYDPLTGLPNRRLLMDRLGQTLAAGARHQRKGALLFVDLDNFKTINDTLGHYQGDMLLEQVARRLTGCIREGDTAARIGGDEFVVMLKDLSENVSDAVAQAETVGGKILAALSQTYPLAGQEYHVTSSVGVTLIGVDQQEGIDEPLKRADLAMYQAKAAGRNTLRFFDPQMQAVVTTRAEMEIGLREALAAKQFVLHYQAQVLGEGRLIGAECLLRWLHPQRGMILPGEFIPLAEESGLILSLGQWVLESACAQLAAWAAQAQTAHLTVAVNVSSRQFRHPDFVAQVLSVLDRTGANPERLKLELTESLLVANIEDVIAKMNALKSKGVNFSLDDFGTGYSSLSYLKRLPLDQLKIDQSFVRDLLIDPNDAVIARTVVALGHSLGLQVMAEGVETPVQHDFLVSIGCDAYQGYFFGRPVAADELAALVAPGVAL